MSSTDSSRSKKPIFLSDPPEEVKRKIQKAFSGCRPTLEEHRQYGADLETDVAYQYLRFFEPNEITLAYVTEEYGKGRLLSRDVKSILTERLIDLLTVHTRQWNEVTHDDIIKFYKLTETIPFVP